MIKISHLKKEYPKVHLKEQPEFQGEQLSEFAKKCNNNCPVPNLFQIIGQGHKTCPISL